MDVEQADWFPKSARQTTLSYAVYDTVYPQSNEVSDEEEPGRELMEDGLHEWVGLVLVFLSAVLAIGVIVFIFI